MASVAGTPTQQDVCAICLEIPTNPTSLPTCTHLFCAACLDSYVRRHRSEANVACPTCTTPCPMADIKSDGLDIDSAHSSSTAHENAPTAVSKGILCTLCSYKGVDATGEYACIDCVNTTMCKNCSSSHKKKACFKNHTLKPLLCKKSVFTPSAKCSKHDSRAMKFMCIDCDELLCEICAGVEHHDDHELVDLEDILEEVSDALDLLVCTSGDLSSVKGEIKATEEQKAVAISQVKSRADVMEREIQNRFTALQKQIRERRADLIAEIQGNAACKQLDHDVSDLVTDVDDSLQRGEYILSQRITSTRDVKASLDTKDQLVKKASNATKIINHARRALADEPTPIFIAGKSLEDFGCLESSPRGISVLRPIRLQPGGQHVLNPCRGVIRAQTFVANDHVYRSSEVAVLLNISHEQLRLWKSCSNKRGFRGTKLTDCYIQGVDMAVTNDGNIAVLQQVEKFIEVYPVNDVGNAVVKIDSKELDRLRSLTQTRTGNYVVIVQDYRYRVECFIQKRDSSPPIQIHDIPQNLSALYSDNIINPEDDPRASIHCLQSQDLILAHNWKGEKVLTLALKCRRSDGNLGAGDMGGLEHYFDEKSPIIAPLKGYHIMDICCDDKKAYFCIKKGARTKETSQPGPIKMYEATFEANKWEYASIPLVDPNGRAFDELKEDELLQLAVNSDTLMCMVYSPIPLAELKECAEPGMNITWYFGKLNE